ncbi:MAG: 30S ribosomal protein S12 methylthiotransferase RimO [Acidobacteriota bacterium]
MTVSKDAKRLATLVSLGCAKNLVDSETMVPQILRLGYVMTDDPTAASLIVVNTCGFLESAVEEALETILSIAENKTLGACEDLVVTGCMVQRYGKKLPALLPEVDLFLGTSHYSTLEEALMARGRGATRKVYISPPRNLDSGARVLSTPFYSAYVKIAEGCGNRCTYCMIPHLRGPQRSRTVEDVLREVRGLAADGVKEINLIAQDTTAFGSDRNDPDALLRLLESLDAVSGLEWVRLLYVYPDRVDGKLLDAMKQSSKVVPYLDIPLQHSVPRILRAMRSGPAPGDTDRLIESIRSHIPDIALRTSIMVGFPGETEEDFEALSGFLERAEFDHAGFFAYSPEPGTKAARMADQVDDETKERRKNRLIELQREISRRRLMGFIDRVFPVLIEGPHPETDLLLAGRLPTQAPEVDGTVIVTAGDGEVGRIVQARITASHDYDLEAELLSE